MDLGILTGYYGRLLAYQYRDRPNATRQIQLWAKQAVADYLAGDLLTCFDIDQAVGAQLDILGKYVGVSRNIGTSAAPPFFSLWPYAATLVQANYQSTWDPTTDTPTIPGAAGGNTGWWYVASKSGTSTSPIAATWKAGDVIFSNGSVWAPDATVDGNGLTTYADLTVNIEGVFYSYAQASRQVSALPDASYRTVIKLKIVLNSNDGTLASILAYLRLFFPDLIFCVDNKDMTLTYLVMSTIPLSVDLLKLYLPKPMGVGINITIINPTPPAGGDVIVTEDGSVITTEDGTPIVTESAP